MRGYAEEMNKKKNLMIYTQRKMDCKTNFETENLKWEFLSGYRPKWLSICIDIKKDTMKCTYAISNPVMI